MIQYQSLSSSNKVVFFKKTMTKGIDSNPISKPGKMSLTHINYSALWWIGQMTFSICSQHLIEFTANGRWKVKTILPRFSCSYASRCETDFTVGCTYVWFERLEFCGHSALEISVASTTVKMWMFSGTDAVLFQCPVCSSVAITVNFCSFDYSHGITFSSTNVDHNSSNGRERNNSSPGLPILRVS